MVRSATPIGSKTEYFTCDQQAGGAGMCSELGLDLSEDAFVTDLASRLKNRVQSTTDGIKVYVAAIEDTFGCEVDYAQLVKSYTVVVEGQKRYSPAQCCGATKTPISYAPDMKHVNIPYRERANLTIQMQERRFTRLTNTFSKKLADHVSVHFHNLWYNFGRFLKSLRVTPAMAAGIAKQLWTMEDVVALIEAKEEEFVVSKPSRRSNGALTTRALSCLTQAG